MLSPIVKESFNNQINAELYSEYLYLSMSAYFESKSLKGMANWMKIQAGEEHLHAMKFFTFIHDRNSRVTLQKIDAPPTEWESPLAAFEEAYKHELKVSGLINNLANISLEEKDHMANHFLQWFINEQVEEEANALAIVDQLKLIGDHGVALYLLDQQLGSRVAAPASAPAA